MSENSETTFREYVTAIVGNQLFGLPIQRVQDVFAPERITRVPLAAPEIAGVLNLRGRIVTLIDMRRRLGLGAAPTGMETMAIGVDLHGESYALLTDGIGEVLNLNEANREANPVNLDAGLDEISAGIFRLDNQLLVIVDVDRILALDAPAAAA